jgi:ribosomal protein S18
MKQKTRKKRRQLKEINKMTTKQVSYKGPELKGDSPDEYGLFVPKFDQFCQDNDIYGYVQAIKHASLPETELVDITGLTQAEQKKIEAAFKKNKEAVGMYTHAVQSLALMNIVSRTKTSDWPSGQA